MRFVPKFLLSAMSPDHFPTAAKTGNAPEVAFLGRSNVGKSSLLNKLVGSAEAKVSSTPGRTRAINFFALYSGTPQKHTAIPALVFADLPGYGYAKISRSISAEWPSFIEPYINEREQLALCICLVDTNIPPQESDTLLITALQQMQRPFLVVGTKSDRLSNNQLNNSLRALVQAHQVERVLAVSAKTEHGIKKLWQDIIETTQA
ncbi:MAG: ribosome biogenesis GTP-binding protein YihA/YsxC [Bryocella sp.]